jgi:predicted phage baseplate assembly protein
MTCTWGCCEGIERLTPADLANPPGLERLAYRVGTHASFLATMKARLPELSVPAAYPAREEQPELRPLAALRTRAADDPAIAFLDAWATVADVLCFYSERIANEGYLRTAGERRSVVELARLVGYQLRPGVAATVYLAFELEDGYRLEIPPGTRTQSVPLPGETMQAFETAEPLEARAEWNTLKVRMHAPQTITRATRKLFLTGVATGLEQGDRLVLVADGSGERFGATVESLIADPVASMTTVWLQADDAQVPAGTDVVRIRRVVSRFVREAEGREYAGKTADEVRAQLSELRNMADERMADALRDRHLPALREIAARAQRWAKLGPWTAQIVEAFEGAGGAAVTAEARAFAAVAGPLRPNGNGATGPLARNDQMILVLGRPPSEPPAGPLALARDPQTALAPSSDALVTLLGALRPDIGPSVHEALEKADPEVPATGEVHALRVSASLFGATAGREPTYEPADLGGELPVPNPRAGLVKPHTDWTEWNLADDEDPDAAYLDAAYETIVAGSLALIEKPDVEVLVTEVEAAVTGARNAYLLSLKSTRLTFEDEWWDPDDSDTFDVIRRTLVHSASEQLELAEQPITDDVKGDTIELQGIYDGLGDGRWLFVTGERTDIPGTQGVTATERVLLAGVTHGARVGADGKPLPGERLNSTIRLAEPLAYSYKRDTVVIRANVVLATHGETRIEVLGSGDASQPSQTFSLRQKPLTFVPAPTPSGIASTLEVRVNEVAWDEAPSLLALGPKSQSYVRRTDDDETTSTLFGDGAHGARLPTGTENVRARYRTGIGRPGNVAAEQISLLATRPLGVKGVINPQAAGGGADRDTIAKARRRVPISVAALERLVSLRDYADFALKFAGIDKASAVPLSDGRRQIVHLTLAGVDDAPLRNTELLLSLLQALRLNGDPHVPVLPAPRELLILVMSANVKVEPRYSWEFVEPRVRAALTRRFSFEARELGQDALLSEAVATVQAVPGVAYVDFDIFDAIEERSSPLQLATAAAGLTLRRRVIAELASFGLARRSSAGPRPIVVGPRLFPAQLVVLKPDAPQTLALNERRT